MRECYMVHTATAKNENVGRPPDLLASTGRSAQGKGPSLRGEVDDEHVSWFLAERAAHYRRSCRAWAALALLELIVLIVIGAADFPWH
jgi:hypothetical protein